MTVTFPAAMGLKDPQVYTMRELNQHTAEVINKINKAGAPALITKHGRFVAMITPLEGKVEPLIMRQIAAEMAAEIPDEDDD